MQESLKARCFRCKKDILIKFIRFKKGYSQKNDWYYWTEKEKNRDKKICDRCLKKLYQNAKLDFRKFIINEKRKQQLRTYISRRII